MLLFYNNRRLVGLNRDSKGIAIFLVAFSVCGGFQLAVVIRQAGADIPDTVEGQPDPAGVVWSSRLSSVLR